MESWPTLGWLLFLSLIADCLKGTRGRDFTVKDIVYLHPSTTPYPGGFKCFTCEQAVDNYECNQWAPDVYCPRATRYCYSQHTLEANGKSVSVTKRCVPLEDCLTTGCIALQHKGLKVCTSCWAKIFGEAKYKLKKELAGTDQNSILRWHPVYHSA
ncbi:ly6/PLAUR domain-containing protein 6 [Crotalus adamanteus]|uniref:Ly6/PLAUR domain-containing protein 6 n=1 Tax=Crotalus adamanteus TaxID=8729 RepID=A0AAW1C942_CROAD